MPKSHSPYPADFRAEAVRLVRSGGRDPEQLARELGCSAQAIRNWVRQADLDAGRRQDGLTTTEREELAQLRRENRVLREEREILRKAAAFFAKEATR
jgi:transposase